ncbi:MAG TPA: hypothetical protein VIU64_21365, partial [Polyangia bacterium]
MFRRRLRRWARVARWAAAAAAVPALWACSSHRLSVPDPQPSYVDQRSFRQNINHKLDLLFMVDDSSSMEPLQKKMSDQLGTFMDILADDSGQLPDLHVAVVSSSMGAGRWKIPYCNPDDGGNYGGKFRQGPGQGSCPMLHQGARFLDTGDGMTTQKNFDGDIAAAFKCMALLGDKGCGFESQFKSVMYALEQARDKNNPDNGGFLRDEAVLAIVMLTNEDDCSVDDHSLLLTPDVNSPKDKSGLGAQRNYRCNEFGHLCDGQPPPHGYPDLIPAGGIELKNCVSAEDTGPKNDDLISDPDGNPDPTHGHLWPTVKDFANYIKSLKPPEREGDILIAAIAGPPTPYRVMPYDNLNTGEQNPDIDHSCIFAGNDPSKPENADPAVRIDQWVKEFRLENRLFFPICAQTLKPAMTQIAERIHQTLGGSCLASDLAWRDPSNHDKGHNCAVERRTSSQSNGGTGSPAKSKLDECQPIVTNADAPERPTNAPCYQLLPSSEDCDKDNANNKNTALFRVCENADCKAPTTSSERVDA